MIEGTLIEPLLELRRETRAYIALFESNCGHRFIGLISGDYTCPVCGHYDGAGHISYEYLPVQLRGWMEDWGSEDPSHPE